MLGILLKSRVYSAAISRDVTIIVAGESDGMVRRWIAPTGVVVFGRHFSYTPESPKPLCGCV